MSPDGSPPLPAPPSLRPHLLLAAICLALWVPTCGLWDFEGPDEPRYVEVAREWLAHPGFALTLHGVPYGEKGPVSFWAMGACLAAAGPSTLEFLARIPSVLAGVATVLLVFALARRLFGERAAWTSALVLLTTPLVLQMAPSSRLDMPFAAWTTLAAFAWLGREGEGPIPWRRWAVLWGAVAAAFLTKGPLALLLVLAVVGAEAIAARSGRVFRAARPLAGLAAVAGVTALWLAGVGLQAGFPIVEETIRSATVKRIAGTTHAHPFWFYLVQFPWYFGPGTLLLVPAVVARARSGMMAAPREFALLAWLAVPFLALSLAGGKRAVYLLPLLPPAALLIGGWFVRAVPEGEALPRTSRGVGSVLLLLAGNMGAFALRLLDRWIPFPPPERTLVAAGAGALLLALAGGVLLLRPRTGDAVLRIVAAALLALATTAYVLVIPDRVAREGSRAFAAALGAQLHVQRPGRPVLGVVGGAEDSRFHVYGRNDVRLLEGADNAFARPESLPDDILFVEGESPRMRAAAEKAGYLPVWRGEAAETKLLLLHCGPR